MPQPGEKKLYIKALEARVAELEQHLAGDGMLDVGEDHWDHAQLQKHINPRIVSNDHSSPLGQPNVAASNGWQAASEQKIHPEEEAESLLSIVRDLSLSASGGYVGGTSTITLGRVLGSVVNSHKPASPRSRRTSTVSYEDPVPKSRYTPSLAEMVGPMFVSSNVADRLLQGFLRHIATRFPVLHTPRLFEMHARRNALEDVYEASILHLVYATGGRWVESVRLPSQCERLF